MVRTRTSRSPLFHITLVVLFIVTPFATSCADVFGNEQFNPYTGKYELTQPGDELQYNPWEGTYQYGKE
jgi:hypothetical protein